MYIDTHAHLFLPEFKDDITNVIQRAFDEKVEKILLPNIDTQTISELLHLSEQYPSSLIPMMGLHPCYVTQDYTTELSKIKTELYQNPGLYCAVGEIGIDLYWDTTYKEEQKIVFREQISWAKELQKPIAIHVRNSFDEVFEIIDEEISETLSGVFHCFTGNEQQMEKILSYPHFYFGIGGVVTFKNSGLDNIVEKMPLERIVLETDSPYLAPTPYRGKRNESSYISLIAQKIASIKNIPVEKVAQVTSHNAKKLFHV